MPGFKEECQPERACKYGGESLVMGFCSFEKLCTRDAQMSKRQVCFCSDGSQNRNGKLCVCASTLT